MTKLHYIDLDEKVKPSAEKCRVNDIYIYIYIYKDIRKSRSPYIFFKQRYFVPIGSLRWHFLIGNLAFGRIFKSCDWVM